MSRLYNSTKSIFFGGLQQFINVLLTFIVRTVFIKYLSVEYLGINSLFSNILTVFSIADLGFGTAILYSMYKPIAEHDEKKLAALMCFYKKIYSIVAIVILVLGLSLIPFLDFFVNDDSIEGIEIYYILFLLDSVISYLLAYKVNIINADQKTYIIKKYTLIFNIIKAVLQCICIIVFKNFFSYVVIQILSTISINIYGAYISKKIYPFIENKEVLKKEEQKSILSNVKSLFIYKIGGIILNNTDNILISILLGVSTVGYYTNYATIITAINSFTNMIFTTITFSVGNLIASDSKEKQYSIFKKMCFLSTMLFSFLSICLIVLFNDLIVCWIGKTFVLDFYTVIAIVINFYMYGSLNTVFMFRDTTGLFNKMKYVAMITAFFNVVLSIIFGKSLGLFGILIATAVSRLLTNFWYEPYILYRDYFNKNYREYLYFNLRSV